MGAYVAPVENMGAVLHEQHVINLATEAALTSQESLDGIFASGAALTSTTNKVDGQSSDLDALRVHPSTLSTLQPPAPCPLKPALRHKTATLSSARRRPVCTPDLLTNLLRPLRFGWPSSRTTTTRST